MLDDLVRHRGHRLLELDRSLNLYLFLTRGHRRLLLDCKAIERRLDFDWALLGSTRLLLFALDLLLKDLGGFL